MHFSCLKDQVTYWQYPITLHNKKRTEKKKTFDDDILSPNEETFSPSSVLFLFWDICHQNGREGEAKNIPFLRLQKYFFLLHYQVGIEQKLWGSWLVGGKKILPYLLQLLSYDALSSGASKRQALSKIALKYNIVTTTTGICVYFCSWTKKELKWEIPVIFSAIFRWCSFLAMANHKKILRQEGVKTKETKRKQIIFIFQGSATTGECWDW